MGPTLVLLASPLLGPWLWHGVARELERLGWPTVTAPASWPPDVDPQTVSALFASALPADGEVVLVPHSNAGLYVPSLAERPEVVGAVFVDAAVPLDPGEVPLAPPGLRTMLAEIADHQGRLPPWSAWWDPADVAVLLPDEAMRRRLERGQPRLTLGYFSETVPVPLGWEEGLTAAYLAFGDTYAEEREAATDLGWPTRTLPGGHLHLLVDPTTVARAIDSLVPEG